MNGFLFKMLPVAGLMVLLSAASLAGVNQQAGIPNISGGTFISCQNPVRVISIVRRPDGTLVSQAGPSGITWRHRLPPMHGEYDQYYVAPDGSAAVVALSRHVGNVYLVSGRRSPTILHGAIGAVDFQGGKVMVALADRSDGPLNVGLYRADSGDQIANTAFMPPSWEDFQYFTVRLSGDGSFYYYLDEMQRLQLRDAVNGKPILLDAPLPGGIEDVLLRSRNHGYLIASGKLFAVAGGRLEEIATPLLTEGMHAEPALPLNLVESTDESIQAVNFHFGWGVRDIASGRWLAKGADGKVLSAGNGVATVLESQEGRVRVFDLSGGSRVLRGVSVDIQGGQQPVCVNAHGVMTYGKDGFVWRRFR